MAELLLELAEGDKAFACDDDGAYFLRGSTAVTHEEMASLAADCTNRIRVTGGGGLLGEVLVEVLDGQREQRDAAIATMDEMMGDCEDADNQGIADEGNGDGGVWNAIVNAWDDLVSWVEGWSDADLSPIHSDGHKDPPPPPEPDPKPADPDPAPEKKDCGDNPVAGCIAHNAAIDAGLAPTPETVERIIALGLTCPSIDVACFEDAAQCLAADDCDPDLFEANGGYIPLEPLPDPEDYPDPDGVFGSGCEQAQAKWSAFKLRCELSGWQEFACDQFVRGLNGCIGDPTRTQPTPDEVDECFSGQSDEELAEARCEEWGGIWSDGGDGQPNCAFLAAPPIPSLPRYALCHDPRADLTAEQCAPAISLPGVSPTPAPDGGPAPPEGPGGGD